MVRNGEFKRRTFAENSSSISHGDGPGLDSQDMFMEYHGILIKIDIK